MTRILLLLTLVGVVLIAVNRDRIFLRDPLAKLERSGAPAPGARIFINYSNDVLVQQASQVYLVQGWNRVPGVPVSLTCIQALACLTVQNHAESTPLLVEGRPASDVVMSNRSVSFADGSGARVRITLR